MQPARSLTPLIRAFTWHRRWFAAILAVLAVAAGLNAVSARASGAVAVVITTAAVPAGTTLAADQLRVTWLPADAVPDDALTSPEAAVGAEAVVGLPARAVIIPGMLLSDHPAVTPGKVALPIRFSDASLVGVLSVGCHLDVLGPASSGDGFSVIAGDVRVLAIPSPAATSPLGGGGSPLVLVEVDQPQAVAISAAAAGTGLSFALR
jgi:Flp pilus assembly protein CpaB